MVCIEKAKLSENIVVSKKSLIAENMINEKKKKGGWMQKAFAKVEKEGHGGKFHDWCVKQNKNWDGCTKACWDKAGEKKKDGEPKYDKQSKMVGLAKAGCRSKKR
jgi:hypothetical protein